MDIHERILRYNAGRDAGLTARKFARMAQTPCVFLRGSCHLFYEDWHGGKQLDAAPLAWIFGDLHLENLGSYKGDKRLAYFVLNDFYEAARAPYAWEEARFLTGLRVAAHDLGSDDREALSLCRGVLAAYAQALADGKARWIERSLAMGMVGELLRQVKRRKRKIFLNLRTRLTGKRRHTSRSTANTCCRSLAPSASICWPGSDGLPCVSRNRNSSAYVIWRAVSPALAAWVCHGISRWCAQGLAERKLLA